MADGNVGNTQAAAFIPEVWKAGFLKSLYDLSFLRKRVLTADGDVANKGDILHIRIAPQMTVQDVNSTTGAVTSEALTPAESQLTVNRHRAVAFSVLDITSKQADEYLQPCLEEGGPKALAEDIDSKLLALYGDFTKTPIDATGGLVADRLLEAFVSLAKSKVVAGDMNNQLQKMSWAFYWDQYPILKKLGQIGEYQITGKPGGGVLDFKIPDILGIPVFFSNLVATSGGEYKNLLLHEEALACGVQQNIKPEKFARTALRNDYVTSVLYGVKSVRAATHAIVVRTTAVA